MPKFDAGSAVEPLEFDFSKYGGKTGTMPEPSQTEFAKFAAKQQSIQLEALSMQKRLDAADKDGKLDAEFLAEVEAEGKKLDDRLSAAIAELFKDQPSVEDMGRLPYRVKQALSVWIVGKFSPEA